MNQTGDLIKQPIFLVGAERSGTTLLRMMLDAHPQISFFYEFEYAVNRVPDPQGWPDLRHYRAYLEADRIFQDAQQEVGLTIDTSLDYPHLVDSFLRQKQARDGKPFVGATIHGHFDRLRRIWPDARFIHIVRDGRDVGRSCMEKGWAGNMYMAVSPWMEVETLWKNMVKELPANCWIDVRYESLVSEPEATLTQLCTFVGVSFDPAMFNYPKNSTYGPPSPKMIGQWKRKLPPKAVQLAEARIAALLLERGYELSDFPALKVTPAMARWLRFQSRWFCAMFRRKQYGNALFLSDLVARRLGPRSWQAQVQMQLDAVVRRSLDLERSR